MQEKNWMRIALPSCKDFLLPVLHLSGPILTNVCVPAN
jgi:hypothetical protein